jgi:catechol 2,3-dioxygenase-like lactoylglutathione lyase family enzyme
VATPARELRFAFTFEDYDAAVHLFRDVFGLPTLMDLEAQGGRGVILSVPSATLEVFDPRHTDVVDRIEAGEPTGGRVRIAVRVDDLGAAADGATSAGAEPVAAPVLTPWGDRNQRFRLPEGLQLTLFEPTQG